MDNLKDTCPCLDCRIRRGETGISKRSDAPNALTGGQQFEQEQTLQRPQDFPGPVEGARIDPLTVAEYDRRLRDAVNATEKDAHIAAYLAMEEDPALDNLQPSVKRMAAGVSPEEAKAALAVNPKDLIGATKAPMSCVPASLTVNAAPVFALGAKKYGRYNWRDYPIQEKAYIEALERHLLAYKDGQELDPESGCSHLAHLIAGAGIVLDALACGTLIRDTEVKPGVTAELIAAQTKKPEPQPF